MEKTHPIFSTILPFFFLLLLQSPGLVRAFGPNQASSLTAFRRAKRFARETDVAFELDDQKLFSSPEVAGTESPFSGDGKMEDDLIRGGLPGQPAAVKFNQYSGYVTVDEGNGRSLFYYFVEADKDAYSKPLILWLNGGPGCSSLGYGAMIELGPFGVNPDGTLYFRQYAWNRAANTLFLESPAGVGFSYSNTTSDYKVSGDKRTAEDTYTFLVNWFRKFPHFKARDLYIMGESYAGHYVPQLADLIIKRNSVVGSTLKIQLKGIMVGNGVMNDETDVKGTYDFLWSHALISDETHQKLRESCMVETKVCQQLEDESRVETGDIDDSNIYGPICSQSDSPQRAKKLVGYYPCEGDYVSSYLNLPQVQEAFHANKTNIPYSWQLCSDIIGDWKDSPSTMIPTYRRLFASGLGILIFSGDVDVIVSVTSTRYSIDAMNLKVVKPWHPWLDEANDVAGYEVVYDGLTFATVRDAGHQVPEYQPRRAFALLKRFLGAEKQYN